MCPHSLKHQSWPLAGRARAHTRSRLGYKGTNLDLQRVRKLSDGPHPHSSFLVSLPPVWAIRVTLMDLDGSTLWCSMAMGWGIPWEAVHYSMSGAHLPVSPAPQHTHSGWSRAQGGMQGGTHDSSKRPNHPPRPLFSFWTRDPLCLPQLQRPQRNSVRDPLRPCAGRSPVRQSPLRPQTRQ